MSNESEGRALAEALRRDQGLGSAPIKDVFELVRTAASVDVFSVDANEAEHGLTMHDPATGRTAIAVATTSHPMRQRSSIAHELGHVLAHDTEAESTSLPGVRCPAEIRADAFARHLLAPLDGVRRIIGGRTHEHVHAVLSDVVQEFGVSPQIAAIQMREIKYINEEQRLALNGTTSRALALTHGWQGHYDSLVQDSAKARPPQGLVTRAIVAYERGLLGIEEVALWYGTDAEVLRDQLAPVIPAAPTNPDEEPDFTAPLFPGKPPA